MHARLSLHLSKHHIVGNYTLRHICVDKSLITYDGFFPAVNEVAKNSPKSQ